MDYVDNNEEVGGGSVPQQRGQILDYDEESKNDATTYSLQLNNKYLNQNSLMNGQQRQSGMTPKSSQSQQLLQNKAFSSQQIQIQPFLQQQHNLKHLSHRRSLHIRFDSYNSDLYPNLAPVNKDISNIKKHLEGDVLRFDICEELTQNTYLGKELNDSLMDKLTEVKEEAVEISQMNNQIQLNFFQIQTHGCSYQGDQIMVIPNTQQSCGISYLNISNFVREMSEIKNTINVFLLDMSRHNNNSLQNQSEELEPIYFPPNGNGSGLSIVLYSCGKGQKVTEVQEKRFIKTNAKCFEGSRTFFAYLQQFFNKTASQSISVRDFLQEFPISCNHMEIVSSYKVSDFANFELFSKDQAATAICNQSTQQTEKIRKVQQNIMDLKNDEYFKGQSLSQSLKSHQMNFLRINEQSDLFTEDHKKEEDLNLQETQNTETLIMRLNTNVENFDSQNYNQVHIIDENDIHSDDRSTFGEGWRGKTKKFEIGNFNIQQNQKNEERNLNSTMISNQSDRIDISNNSNIQAFDIELPTTEKNISQQDQNVSQINKEKRGLSIIKNLFSFKKNRAVIFIPENQQKRSMSPSPSLTILEPLDFKDSFKLQETEGDEEIKEIHQQQMSSRLNKAQTITQLLETDEPEQFISESRYITSNFNSKTKIEMKDDSYLLNEKLDKNVVVPKSQKLTYEQKQKTNRIKNRKSSDGQIQLNDPFGNVSTRKYSMPDAQTSIKFLYQYNEQLIAIANKHIYVLDISSRGDGKIIQTINLNCEAQFSFLKGNKLHVGGSCIDIFNLEKKPIPNITTVKKQLNPMPKKVMVIDNFIFYSGECIFKFDTFDSISVLDLNPEYQTTRVLLDFTSCNKKELMNEDSNDNEFAIATNEGLCFVNMSKVGGSLVLKQNTEYYLQESCIQCIESLKDSQAFLLCVKGLTVLQVFNRQSKRVTMQVKLPENKFYDEDTQYLSLQTIKIEGKPKAKLGMDANSQEEAELKFFLVRDDTRLMLLNFDGGDSEMIATVPLIDKGLLHQTVLVDNRNAYGPPQIKVWAVQHKPKSKIWSVQTRRKIYEFSMPYFIRKNIIEVGLEDKADSVYIKRGPKFV